MTDPNADTDLVVPWRIGMSVPVLLVNTVSLDVVWCLSLHTE